MEEIIIDTEELEVIEIPENSENIEYTESSYSYDDCYSQLEFISSALKMNNSLLLIIGLLLLIRWGKKSWQS